MKSYILTLLIVMVGCAIAWADTDDSDKAKKTDKNTKKIVEELEKEFLKKNKVASRDKEIGDEALKPITEVDPEKLIEEILKRMEISEKEMLSAKPNNSEGGLQEEIIQGLNRVHGNIIRDMNKLIDFAKMFKSSDKPSPNKSNQSGEVQKEKPNEKTPSQGNKSDSSQTNQQNNQSSDPATAPYDASGEDFKEDLDRVDASGSRWGDLPPADRADIEHARSEGKIPKYQKWIEDYMKRLNEQK